MRYLFFGLTTVAVLFASVATADDALEEAIKKDRERIRGTWRVAALTINGKRAADADARKITVVNGDDGTWSIRSEGKEISRGTSTFDPTKTPKTIDFTPTEGGGKGDKFFGIYQLDEDTRTLCFAPAGKDRPTDFASTSENQQVLVVFERVEPELPQPAPPTPLAELLQERQTVLRRLVEVETAGWRAGSTEFKSVVLALDQLLEAELELAEKPATRIAILQKRVDAMQSLKAQAEQRFQEGWASRSECLKAEAALLALQIQLVREQAGERLR